MPGWKTVHLFVSSTFKDTQTERDVLVRRVFPELRARLLRYRIHLIDVDLRWGVEGDDESLTAEICSEVLSKCLPRFIGIIGNRYGWIPPGSERSITEQEISQALESDARPIFMIRDPALPSGAESLPADGGFGAWSSVPMRS
jgi:Domain of unknown function (DUF4062)